jgi:two-component system, LytTR family, sensor histidine kinase AlgZ
MRSMAQLPDKKRQYYFKSLLLILGRNLAATLASVLILTLFGNLSTLRQIKENFIISFIYSNCIGTMVALSFPFILSRTRHRLILLLISLLGLSIFGSLLGGIILVGIGTYALEEYWPQFYFCLRLSILITGSFGITMFIYGKFRLELEDTALQLRTKELEEERALKLATEARLSSLESRIHPHFLFNTLNSISALIQEDPQMAERLVERLAALLRFSLDAGHRGLVPLDQELKIVKDYLEIERARFGDRLKYSIDVASEFEQILVPPLSLQTLVENSVKFAVSPSRAGARIQVSALKSDGKLRLEIWDDGPGFSTDKMMTGHGLDNLQSRLSALFGKDAEMDISQNNGGTAVAIILPQTRAGDL